MGQLVFQATAGGQVALVGPNPTSNFSLNVPAVNGNLVTTGDTGTVTNTMLASSAYTAPGTIGSGTPNTGAFTTLSASSTVSGTGFSTYLASPPAIGGTTPSTGKFTSITNTGLTSGYVVYASTGGLETGSSNLYFDGTNLGIGTTSPKNKFDMSGGDLSIGSGQAFINNMYYSGGWKYIGNGYGGFIKCPDASGNTTFNGTTSSNGSGAGASASPQEFMRIDSSGNLLVGTTTTDPIGIRTNGSLISAPAGSFQSRFSGGSFKLGLNSSSGYSVLFFTDNGSTYISAGNISSNGSSTSYNTGSDYRMKENIQPMNSSLNKIMQLKPVTYTWKQEFAGTNIDGEGFVAHELQQIIPQAVTGEKDAVDSEGKPVYQSIDTSFLVATLTASIQELKAIVDAQAQRIAVLEAK